MNFLHFAYYTKTSYDDSYKETSSDQMVEVDELLPFP